ncbi:hypothetical protein [Candidatus Thiothrix anitrata]|uniref:Uncharacterized protein n=1 Tax=Candidatus Thiothrix anitrata TaxID=2823902 RepID=A0ABX7X8Q3_9GAMM|nr:hypothetical protein [Candidatus Thiothrix anitrata]QTR51599.1 hypothetical protein J8380_08685 [Candidatus Thiothrix anitrata]
MENALAHNVVTLPVKAAETPASTTENSGFQGDLGLAGFWQDFGRGFFAKKVSESGNADEVIPGLEMASKQADDIKKQDEIRKVFIKYYFMREEVRACLAKFFVANKERPRQDQLQAITVMTRLVRPGMDVNLRELESQIAEQTPESITTNYLRHDLIPLMKDIGLIIQPKEGVNGWQWRDIEKKPSAKEMTAKALKQVALMTSPVHRELLDEQAKRYALLRQQQVLKQRIHLEKSNQQLILQAQAKAEENEKAMLDLGMKKAVSNTPAWIASAGVALIAVVLLAGQGGGNNGNNTTAMPTAQAGVTTFEAAPDYHAIDDEMLLRLQYQQAGIDWDSLPVQDRQNLIKELKQERLGR